MKKYTFTIDNEHYTMDMEELARNLSRDFVKTFLTETEYNIFCNTQENIWNADRIKQEEYRYKNYIYDELGNYYN